MFFFLLPCEYCLWIVIFDHVIAIDFCPLLYLFSLFSLFFFYVMPSREYLTQQITDLFGGSVVPRVVKAVNLVVCKETEFEASVKLLEKAFGTFNCYLLMRMDAERFCAIVYNIM